ncbi:MAG: hypothetical protein IJY94_06220 [Clostridia bacterium]|nr:hypothetical protein [Clostridia bacterium]
MAKRQKEKLFEEIRFQDVEKAKRVYTLAKINQTRILIGFIISVIAMIFTAIAIWGDGSVTIPMILAIPAYIIGGGIIKALKVAWKITKIGWFLIPMFPADVLIAIACFIFAVVGLLFVPVIFVGINYVQHKKTLDAATAYLIEIGELADAASTEE